MYTLTYTWICTLFLINYYTQIALKILKFSVMKMEIILVYKCCTKVSQCEYCKITLKEKKVIPIEAQMLTPIMFIILLKHV